MIVWYDKNNVYVVAICFDVLRSHGDLCVLLSLISLASNGAYVVGVCHAFIYL